MSGIDEDCLRHNNNTFSETTRHVHVKRGGALGAQAPAPFCFFVLFDLFFLSMALIKMNLNNIYNHTESKSAHLAPVHELKGGVAGGLLGLLRYLFTRFPPSL